MHRHRLVARLATCLAAVAALLVAGAGVGQAAPPTGPGGTGGTAHGTGTGPGLSFSFDVTEHGADPHAASGYFRAALTPPAGALIAPQGPATCVDVRGDSVGFLYPLADGTRPAAVPLTSILITAHDGGPGRPDSIGFVGPLPTAAFAGRCAPAVAFLPVTSGDVVVHPGS
ncbi:hypothetical protein LQ327_27325 [Actinomycetospora endophytica]|uniref:Secreted protein n=1 Tax=Actinomycetospora endophytica TaxID=2291215 RepID=A0ABS8PFT6_9PSEU|nr:hypothetical protein [Actinomycetospora endophytica]MCD2197088.1 hypothetical protein [Actinomycetospora endophytica]